MGIIQNFVLITLFKLEKNLIDMFTNDILLSLMPQMQYYCSKKRHYVLYILVLSQNMM